MDNIITSTAVFVVVWWLVLFITLPFGVKRTEEADLEPGQEPGAPEKPMMWRKIGVTTLITIALWCIFYYVDSAGLISFRPE
jgi:predicted secreted protein